MGRDLHSERHSELSLTSTKRDSRDSRVTGVLATHDSRHRHHSLVTAGSGVSRNVIGDTRSSGSASARDARLSLTDTAGLTRVFPHCPPSDERQPTTNPSRLGRTKRQRHVRHNISSSGKRATRSVARRTPHAVISRIYGRINRKTHTPLFVFVAFVPPSSVCSENGRDGRERRYPSRVRPDPRSLSLPRARNEDGASACVITVRDVIGPRT